MLLGSYAGPLGHHDDAAPQLRWSPPCSTLSDLITAPHGTLTQSKSNIGGLMWTSFSLRVQVVCASSRTFTDRGCCPVGRWLIWMLKCIYDVKIWSFLFVFPL